MVKEAKARLYKKGNARLLYIPDEIVLDSQFPEKLRDAGYVRIRIEGNSLVVEPVR